MIIDFRSLPDASVVEADVCVVGGGAAGITLTQSLSGKGLTVCLIESGGAAADANTQALYEAEISGASGLPPLARARHRRFGGTTTDWGGGCMPMLDRDYMEIPYAPRPGWPISKSELEPYYLHASRMFHLENSQTLTAPPAAPPKNAFVPIDPESFRYLTGDRNQLDFGAAYRDSLHLAPDVTVLLHANLVELETNDTASVVELAHIRSLTGVTGCVRAKRFILACGGVENARLLLLSDAVASRGLGNANDLVGRYFMDHPCVRIGTVEPNASNHRAKRLTERNLAGLPDICLTDSAQESGRLLSTRYRITFREGAVPSGVRALREFRRSLTRPGESRRSADALRRTISNAGDIIPAISRKLIGQSVVKDHYFDCHAFFEQQPNPSSRVSLDQERDALGQRKARLEWQFTEFERHYYTSASRLFQSALLDANSGYLHLDPWLDEKGDIWPALNGSCHHMGTTRMAENPRDGVVDLNSKVHGIHNLYVAGSSVFPNSACFYPTFTIVVLALRLAEHLSKL